MSGDCKRIITHRPLFGSGAAFSLPNRETKERFQKCMCGVTRLNNCVNCNHLSGENEPLVRMSGISLDVLNYFYLDSRKQVYSIKQRVQVHMVGPRDVSHGRTSAFHDHLDHRTIGFKNEKRCPFAGAVSVWRNIVYAVW